MRKRRRLADKLTIFVCAVLVAVSAFFYAPMDVKATESVSSTGSVSDDVTGSAYKLHQFPDALLTEISLDDFGLNLDDSSYYRVNLIYDLKVKVLNNMSLRFVNVAGTFFVGDSAIAFSNDSGSPSDSIGSFTSSGSVSFVSDGISLKSIIPSVRVVGVIASTGNVVNRTLDFTLNVSNVSVEAISSNDAGQYESGYNAGYSAGESAGYGNGYSDGFADGEASVDTDKIYDEAFQAGKDSVDTQSYYDAGYQAGYDTAYSAGYESGYDEGYQSAMDRIDGWGADTNDYPLLLYDNSLSNLKLFCDVKTDFPQVAYGDYYLPQFNFNVNPNHTYKVVFNSSQYTYSSAYFSGSQRADLVYNMGSLELPWNVGESFAFVQGSSFTSNVRLQSYIYSSIADGSPSGQAVITLNSLNVKVYDYGPSGDTQNHIANQTDQLTGGYNDSQGNSVNNDFSAGLNDFETAEDSLFATATTGLKDFTFFDIQSVPAMVTGMSFVGSIMSGWFTQAGGASGVGIVLSILFSIMLVAMVLGLYRWYQSKGGKD